MSTLFPTQCLSIKEGNTRVGTSDFQDKLFHLRVRTPKKQSAYLYFQLEANEGLCFYSTNDESLGTSYRDIDIQGHQSLEKETLKVLGSLSEKITLEILFHHHYLNDEKTELDPQDTLRNWRED